MMVKKEEKKNIFYNNKNEEWKINFFECKVFIQQNTQTHKHRNILQSKIWSTHYGLPRIWHLSEKNILKKVPRSRLL